MAVGQALPAGPDARPRGPAPGPERSVAPAPLYAALDLGTNNCRLLVARRAPGGFRVVDSFSRIVRLGEGLAATGRLSEAAMARTLSALEACADKLSRRPVARLRSVATEACRAAENGTAFLSEVRARTGLHFDLIGPGEEARLAVLGCRDLFDPGTDGALVVDIGGGSTELCWALKPSGGRPPKVRQWLSAPLGVVTLAERHPETADRPAWYGRMKAEAAGRLEGFDADGDIARRIAAGRGQVIGTSGAVTSLAGVHLGLDRYRRSAVDGLSLDASDARAVIQALCGMDRDRRAREPCIGAERADLVLAGAAILDAVMERWPAARVRVADRGLREGLIHAMMAPPKRRRAGRRR